MHDFPIKVRTALPGKTHLFYAGQAGYIIKSKSGQTLAIDLYLSECGERFMRTIGFKRLQPHILEPYELEFDCIVATHPHFDHFDMDAMPMLMSNGRTRLFASVDCEREVTRLRMSPKNISYFAPGDSHTDGDFKIDFINCDHGRGAPDALGVIITVDGFKIGVVGDSCLRLDRADEFTSQGALDILIGPINGAFGNLNEEDFTTLVGVVKPKLAIPCHCGMFAAQGGDPGKFMKFMAERNPDIAYTLMQMGEQMTL